MKFYTALYACCTLALSSAIGKADEYALKYLYGPADFANNPYPNEITFTGGTITENGITCTSGQSISASMYQAFPSLATNKTWAVAMTFAADSLSIGSGFGNLFHGLFSPEIGETDGKSLNLGYDTTTGAFQSSLNITNQPGPGVASMLEALPQGEALTIMINQTGKDTAGVPANAENTIFVTVFSGRTQIGTFEIGKWTGEYRLHDFTIGDKDGETEFTLQGMGVIVNGSPNEQNGKDFMTEYFDKVNVPKVPEPSSTLLALAGSGIFLARRRRRSSWNKG